MPIRVLPPEVAAQIAAGEVVERPASVVKELIDNALDAGASRIDIEVRGGGVDLIRVSDNGCGIEPQELELAFARHATSKLASAAGLGAIASLGFRGEALPSIAAVAEVEVLSRPPDAPVAAYLKLVGGALAPESRGNRGAPVGTSVAVRHLFARQPARRKFLRSPQAEAQQIGGVVSHYALAYPEVHFSLTIDGRQSLLSPGSGGRRDAVAAVYGPTVAAAMLDVAEELGLISIEGLLAPPHISRASRGYISLFVNRRWIQSRRLAFAVEEAYQGLLMAGRHPIAALDIRLPLAEVDVNVHPTKAEVRFRDETAVFAAVQRAVRRALLTGAPMPQGRLASTAMGPMPASLHLSPQPTMSPLWQHAVALEKGDEGAAPRPVPSIPALALPALRVIGQFGSTYIIAEGPEGMYLIDQHAAHERVLFEAILGQRQAAQPQQQGLLEPLLLEVSPRQEALLAQEAQALAEHGFRLEPFGPRAYLLRAVPALLAGGDPRQSVLAFLDLMLDEEGPDPTGGDPSPGSGGDRVAMSLACHGAVRAGKTLSMEEMQELVRQLEASQVPNTCPHGRPTMIHVSAEMLAREFGRH